LKQEYQEDNDKILLEATDHQQLALIDVNNDGEIEVQIAKSFIGSESGEDDDISQGDTGGVEGKSEHNKMLHNTSASGDGEVEDQEQELSASQKKRKKKKEEANRNLQNEDTTGEGHFSDDLQQEDKPKEKKRRRRKRILCEQLVFKVTIYTDPELIECVCYLSQIGVCIF
jgi:hypothetical protein